MLFRNKLLPLFVLLLVFIAFWLGTRLSGSPKREDMVAGSIEKFQYLSKQSSNRCSLLGNEIVSSMADTDRIQGSCCSPMDLHSYQKQVEDLKKYKNVPQVPPDPYDIPVSLAKELFSYQKKIQLTSDEQKIYDEAMKMAKEGGPCCCHCWRWDAFEGQAKYLITKNNFTANQIAELWDLEDGCGGVS